ncbi:PepSY domain-containing protein [Microbulbifer agarilyticus]|uniref:PepSY domain-containing protein n=1 Tax=Microbulbifer agarilyticus TaxID=260552 RepID=UPI001CD1E906|nr:PepSY domain-containing protein [Microbulbifer agarilyticus]MCA0901137.1 PepSY domain-containing protein [Microbulbifer agarilyticus]
MKNVKNSLLAVTLGGIAAVAAAQDDTKDKKPPPGAMALSMVLTKLEQQGYTPVVEVTLEQGRWEIEAYKEGKKWDLEVDPNSGEILEMKEDNN